MNIDIKTREKFEELKEKGKEQKPQENKRFIALFPEKPTNIEQWREAIANNFPDLVFPAEAGLSVIAQLLIEDIKNPFALVFVDVPSSGKTITLNFFSSLKELIYTTDNFTPAAFVSHAARIKPEKLAENDMLPQIRYRTLMVRDLAPIFAKRDEDAQQLLGTLIRVLDGEGLETNSGLHGKRGYTGDYLFMMLSASTPIRPKIWKVMGSLGSRLFFFNIRSKEKSVTQLADQLKNSCREKEYACREITEEIIKTIWNKYPKGINWNKENDNHRLMEVVGEFAKVLARLRSAIHVEESFGQDKNLYMPPITEMPDRLNQLLYNLMRGHALVCGRENISEQDLKMVARVTLDSAPPQRAKLFRHLLENNGQLKTNEVIDILECSRPTALKYMTELAILGIAYNTGNMNDLSDNLGGRPEQQVILKDSWFISDECKQLLNTAPEILN